MIAPALRALLSPGEALKVVTLDDSPSTMRLAGASDGEAMTALGPLCPDQIVYCKSFPLWFEDETGSDPVESLTHAVGEYQRRYQTLPNVVLVKGLGLFAAGDTWSAADSTRQVYKDAIDVMAGAVALGGVVCLRDELRLFIEDWEVESYRRDVASSGRRAGRVAGKVALVTGAAQGFGLQIAQDLVAQGAHVAMADVNDVGARSEAEVLSAQWGEGRAIGLSVDVADAASVDELVHQVVQAYGGLDLLVSNAGVLRAASVKTQAERDFDLSTAVNYKGYFLCVQKAVPVMAVPAPRASEPLERHRPDQLEVRTGRIGQELRLRRQQVRRSRSDPILRPRARCRRDQSELGLPRQLLGWSLVVGPGDRAVCPVLERREDPRCSDGGRCEELLHEQGADATWVHDGRRHEGHLLPGRTGVRDRPGASCDRWSGDAPLASIVG